MMPQAEGKRSPLEVGLSISALFIYICQKSFVSSLHLAYDVFSKNYPTLDISKTIFNVYEDQVAVISIKQLSVSTWKVFACLHYIQYLKFIFGSPQTPANNALLKLHFKLPDIVIYSHESLCIIRHKTGVKTKYNFPCTDKQPHLIEVKEQQLSDKSAGDKNRFTISLETFH